MERASTSANTPKDVETSENSPSSTGQRRKRRAKTDGSTGETPSRLERKRLSDRRSQRAMREKTKQRIAELESALQALLATNVNRELKEKIQENQALKDEVTHLQQRLERIGRLCFESTECIGSGQDRIRGSSVNIQSSKTSTNLNRSDDKSTVEANTRSQKPSNNECSVEGNLPDIPASPESSPYQPEDATVEILNQDNAHLMPYPSESQDRTPFDTQGMWSSTEIEMDCHSDIRPQLPGADEEDLQVLRSSQNTFQGFGNVTVSTQYYQPSISTIDPDLLKLFDADSSCGSENSRLGSNTSSDFIRSSDELRPQSFLNSTNNYWPLEGVFHFPRAVPQGIICGSVTFEQWVRNTVEKYRDLPKETLDDLLPSEPCMAPIFSSSNCSKTLSKALAHVVRIGAPGMELVNFIGMYWCQHKLLRYYLRPVQEELIHLPQYMLPTGSQATTQLLSWLHFLPWPHLRDTLLAQPSRHYDLELDQLLAKNVSLYWPYSTSEALIFHKVPDIHTPAPTNLDRQPLKISQSGRGHSGCNCSAPQLTERFKSHLARVQNWSLKPAVSHLGLRKYPEFMSVMR